MATALHQLGSFIVYFQHVEATVNELTTLLVNGDSDVVQILTNGLGYAERVKVVETLFVRQEYFRGAAGGDAEKEFRALCGTLLELGSRRNHFVHSRWFHWTNTEGRQGLLRRNQRLKRGEAFLQEKEEELQSEDFEKDLDALTAALRDLERFRLGVIDLLYPETE